MIDPQIRHYYDSTDEGARLASGAGQLEYVRSLELLVRHLPPAPARVLDIGGGTGSYSEALARLGYEMHLFDPMPKHVASARSRPGIASVRIGDARQLDWPDRFADAVLLMGPMYHLTAVSDREMALIEARRVLKPGGLAVIAAISRFASFVDGLVDGSIDDPLFQEIMFRDLQCGEHRNATGNHGYFTTAHFHLPDELTCEMESAGFSDVRLYAVEGPAWIAHDFTKRWADPAQREMLLRAIRMIEEQPSILGVSAHILAIGRASS